MSLDKLIGKIEDDARLEAENILNEGQKKASQILDEARRETDRLVQELLKEHERQGALEANRIITQARLRKRLDILSCKKDLIAEVLQKAFEKTGLTEKDLSRTVVLKDGENRETMDAERLKEELQQHLEKFISGLLKI
jgi:vacuolar-type H+-ATPase subunit E/Vma4